jgi:CHAD domain-containing protein
VPNGIDAAGLAERLRGQLQVSLAAERRRPIVLHDTFSWQLWRRELLLVQFDRACAVCHLDRLAHDEAIATCDIAGTVPRFWWEWPAGPVRDRLRELTGFRALTPVAAATIVTQRIDLRNEDGKSVARLVVERCLRSRDRPETPEQVVATCRILPVRGYDAEAAAVQGRLQEAGFPRCDSLAAEMILEQAERRPPSPSNEPRFLITADLNVREAISRLAAESLATSRRCERGIADDIDTEFLHEFRVGLRRVRSALKLVKHVYPQDVTARLTRQLGQCARRTNRLRDLDVFLLQREEYREHAPTHLASALDEMYDDLRGERSEEQRGVAAYLRSSEYRSLITSAADVFAEDRWWPVTLNSHLPVVALGNRVIPRRYRKIHRMSGQLTSLSPDAQIHDIRLQVKKLRYLLEFFGNLYPAAGAERLLRRLKQLQKALGAFNDLTVQQQSLTEYVQRKAMPSKNMPLLLAVGSLIGALHVRQRDLRLKVAERLEAFASPPTEALVTQLCGEKQRGAA